MPYIENEILERLITTMVEGFARVEKKLDHMNRLKESQRTLARYREKGIIRYYCMNENGKNLYLASEIRDFLRQKGKEKV